MTAEGSVPRTVIFVGGTAYSGSTLLDMILANDPAGFSCGELNAAVSPYLPHHTAPASGCGVSRATAWPAILASSQPHEAIFNHHPNVRFIVDSSKDIPWIKQESSKLRRNGVDVRFVLIWKTPAEYYASREKRGERQHWAESWINYNRAFMALLHPFIAVQYADLVRTSGTLEALCDSLDLAFTPEKHKYWQREQATLFGNSSAKIHLHSGDSEDFQRMATEITAQKGVAGTQEQQSVYYQATQSSDHVEDATSNQLKKFSKIETTLRAHGPSKSARKGEPWPLAMPYLWQTTIKHGWRSWRFAQMQRRGR